MFKTHKMIIKINMRNALLKFVQRSEINTVRQSIPNISMCSVCFSWFLLLRAYSINNNGENGPRP